LRGLRDWGQRFLPGSCTEVDLAGRSSGGEGTAEFGGRKKGLKNMNLPIIDSNNKKTFAG